MFCEHVVRLPRFARLAFMIIILVGVVIQLLDTISCPATLRFDEQRLINTIGSKGMSSRAMTYVLQQPAVVLAGRVLALPR